MDPGSRLDALLDSQKRGWNTWNSRSVLSHVHLPQDSGARAPSWR